MTKHQKINALLKMNWSTARNRLTRDLLYTFIKDTPCHLCGGEMSRDNFTIDHVTPWRRAEDPIATFFDVENCKYAHLSCNSREGGKIGGVGPLHQKEKTD